MRAILAPAAAVLLLSHAAGAARAPRSAHEADAVIDAAAGYLRHYQQQLTSVMASEVYTQRVLAQVPRDRAMPMRRTLKSDIFFMFAPGHAWMAIREVIEMDGLTVADRLDLRGALQTQSAPEVARRFKAHNSRYNLGHVERNFNEPTLSLLVLDDRHRARFTFDPVRTSRDGGEDLIVYAFRERRVPTLVWNLNGDPAFSSGELTIEPKSGRITRAMMALTIGTVAVTMTTTYAREPRLGLWVPSRFGEHYRDGKKGDPYFEEITGEARYAGFQQFEVKTRIR